MSTNVRNVNGILPVKLLTQPIIPLVYSNALSYMEMVAKLTEKVNEVIDNVNNIQTDILTDANAYTDNAVQEALGDISRIVNEINKLKIDLSKQYDEFVNLTLAQLNIFDSRLVGLNERIDDAIIGVNERTDLAIEQNNEYIINHLSNYLARIRVINFFTGGETTIQNMFDYLAMLHVDNSMDYNHLVGRNLTFTQLNGLNISYTDMVLHGKDLIG